MLESYSANNPIVLDMKINCDAEGVPVYETYCKEIAGSLMYLTSTASGLTYATILLRRYMARPTKPHLQVAK